MQRQYFSAAHLATGALHSAAKPMLLMWRASAAAEEAIINPIRIEPPAVAAPCTRSIVLRARNASPAFLRLVHLAWWWGGWRRAQRAVQGLVDAQLGLSVCEEALLSVVTAALVGPVAAELGTTGWGRPQVEMVRPLHCGLRTERKRRPAHWRRQRSKRRRRPKRRRRHCAPCRVHPNCQPYHRPFETEACADRHRGA